jgi:hypothetical protein
MLMVGTIILLFFLVAACGILTYLYLSPSPGSGGPGQGGNGGTGNNNSGGISLNTTTTNISAEDMGLWDSITLSNVQAACLQKAKEEAGGSASMVYTCACTEAAQPLVKSYECSIETADPFTEYFANIDCLLDRRTCVVETNYGSTNVSFSELRGYYSG